MLNVVFGSIVFVLLFIIISITCFLTSHPPETKNCNCGVCSGIDATLSWLAARCREVGRHYYELHIADLEPEPEND